ALSMRTTMTMPIRRSRRIARLVNGFETSRVKSVRCECAGCTANATAGYRSEDRPEEVANADGERRAQQGAPSLSRRLLVLTLVLSACARTAQATPTPTASVSPTSTATAAPTASPSPTADCAGRTLAAMTEDQRIGQLFLLGLANDQLGAAETNAIRTYHFGSVWFVEQSTAGADAVRRVADAVQTLATVDTTANVRF